MKTTQGAEQAVLQAFCERHLPDEQQNIRATALAAEEEQGDNKHSSKAARAYNKTYKPGPPIVPAIIVNRITQYIHRIKIRKKIELVQLICRYWSLKREARRGAPLLKRLHLEPWTASGGKIQTIEEKRMKLEVSRRLFRPFCPLKARAV
jgi:NuA3 HAT complex component NTO1